VAKCSNARAHGDAVARHKGDPASTTQRSLGVEADSETVR
jgi:hypothetical protein